MNKKILKTGVQSFIYENLNTDIVSVLLKKPLFEGISQQELAQQIESRKRSQKKLPTWFKTSNIYYPKKIHIAQTSSEIAAAYKNQLIDGKSLADLTGGLGIDSFYFSKKIKAVYHFEIDENLHEIASYNFKILDAKHIQTFVEDGVEFLKKSEAKFDWLYLDPSRRNKSKGKVFQLSDCEPNIIDNLELLFSKSENILLKTSPLLDISKGIKELQNVKEIHVIAVNNEVKEVLWVLKRGFHGEIEVKTNNLRKSDNQTFNFTLSEENNTKVTYGQPSTYFYEPNSAILKSGGFKIIGNSFQLSKLNPSTHLYTSKKLIDFPGRRFKVMALKPYSHKSMKELNIKRANITTRNFPDPVATIRKRFKIKDGGSNYLFFFRDYHNHLQIARCQKA